MINLFQIPCLIILLLIVPFHVTKTFAQYLNSMPCYDLRTNGFDNFFDTSSVSYQRDSAMWVFQLGYFPHYGEVASSGYLFGIQYEKQSKRLFDRGWYLIVKQTFTTKRDGLKGGITIGPYVMVERFGFSTNAVLVKFGPGVFISGLYGGLSLLFSLEYESIIGDNIAFSLIFSQETILFKYFFPIQIGVSTKF